MPTGIVGRYPGHRRSVRWTRAFRHAHPSRRSRPWQTVISEMLLSHRELLERDFGKGLISLRDQFS